MENYPSNARSKREETREVSKSRVERVANIEVTRRKKGRARRVLEMFIGGEPKSVGEFVLGNVLVPAFRDLVSNGFQEMIDGVVYGADRNRGGRYRGPSNMGSQYHRVQPSRLTSVRPDPRAPLSRQTRDVHDYEELVFPKKFQADEILDRLFDLIERYNEASVRDLYELVGIRAEYTDEKYGWTDIRDAEVRPIRGGFLLDLPRPEPLR